MPLYSSLARSLGLFAQEQKLYEDRFVLIEGSISDITGICWIYIDDKENHTLITRGKIYRAKGYMIINDACDRIEIMEKTLDDKTELRERIKNIDLKDLRALLNNQLENANTPWYPGFYLSFLLWLILVSPMLLAELLGAWSDIIKSGHWFPGSLIFLAIVLSIALIVVLFM